eukprot:gene33638-45054_t
MHSYPTLNTVTARIKGTCHADRIEPSRTRVRRSRPSRHMAPSSWSLRMSRGSVLGWVYARALIKRQRLWGGEAPVSLLEFDDFILWVTLGIILGGRTGYVLFYNLDFFIAHPAEILELWKGGMSFHGGFMGCVVARGLATTPRTNLRW